MGKAPYDSVTKYATLTLVDSQVNNYHCDISVGGCESDIGATIMAHVNQTIA